MTVFVDTSALYALLDADDENHRAAADAFASSTRTDVLVTHNYVVVETAALVQRRLGVEAVRSLVDDVLPPVELIWIDERLHRSATAAMIASGSARISLVDWTSFEAMRDQGIDRAMAFDDDFARQGFQLVVNV